MLRSFLTLLLAASSLVTSAAADELKGFTYSLFDGKSLDAWVVTECEAEVQDGAILLKDGNGLVRTQAKYSDFVLELDWKALKDDEWDSGIYFRAELPPAPRPWPTRYQANLLKGLEGNVGGVEGAESKGLTKPGEWNHFKLTVVGTKASMEINGTPAWEADGIANATGYIGLQAEVPKGGQFLFKNIEITELGYRGLLDAELSQWEGAGQPAETCWSIEDGVLFCEPKKGPWLRSKEQVGDFNLRLEYKVNEGGNSGVYVRVPESGNHHGKDAGVEIQILDDFAERYAKLKKYQYTGSVYAVAPSQEHVGNPAGEWNLLEIDAKGQHYRIHHNGVLIVDASPSEFPQLEERLLKGFLGLQHHGGGVWYRQMRIGPSQP